MNELIARLETEAARYPEDPHSGMLYAQAAKELRVMRRALELSGHYPVGDTGAGNVYCERLMDKARAELESEQNER